jgi:hypothetical protein
MTKPIHLQAWRRSSKTDFRLLRLPGAMSPHKSSPEPGQPGYTPTNFVYNSAFNKRKRSATQDDSDQEVSEHLAKKSRETILPRVENGGIEYAPLTPISPPTQVIDPFLGVPINSVEARHTARPPMPAYYQDTYSTPSTSLFSQTTSVEPTIPPQNLILRDIHLNSRTYHLQQKRLLETSAQEEFMLEEEDAVQERYSAMNKLLGTRNLHR